MEYALFSDRLDVIFRLLYEQDASVEVNISVSSDRSVPIGLGFEQWAVTYICSDIIISKITIVMCQYFYQQR